MILEKPENLDAVLIVDDDPVFRMLLEQVLMGRGLRSIEQAGDGVEALAVLDARGDAISAITLDLSMPNLDGVRFLRAASDKGFKGRLILASGENRTVVDSAARLARMLCLNCAAALSKPIDFNAIADAVIGVRKEELAAPKRTEIAIGDVASGLRDSRLFAFYQPRVRASDGSVAGAEALARMRGADGEMYDAGRVIELAEQGGMITEITWRMIQTVARDAAQLRRTLGEPIKFSFNVSNTILADPEFADTLQRTVAATGLRPADFIVELTESRLPVDASQSLETLTVLRMQGFGVAIDDFGTGYSNLEQLKMFPFTELKIDKGFMSAAHRDGFAAACVETSVALAREMNLTLVAEGVETEADAEFARQYGIEELQGYLFARPLPLADFCDFVQMRNARSAAGAFERRRATA